MVKNTRGKVYNKKTYKRKSTGKRMPSTKSLVQLIKQVNIKQSETKYKTLSIPWSSMVHDNVYKRDLWNNSTSCFPNQGTTDGNRIGDRIVCQGIQIRAVFDIPWDRKNLKLKLFYLQYNTDQGDPTTYGNFFII